MTLVSILTRKRRFYVVLSPSFNSHNYCSEIWSHSTMVSGFVYQYQSSCLKINNLKGFLNYSRGSLLRCSQQTRFLPLAYDLSNPLFNMSS